MAQAQTHLPAPAWRSPGTVPCQLLGPPKPRVAFQKVAASTLRQEKALGWGVGGSQAVSGDKELREGGQAFPTRVVPGQTHDNDRN